MQIILVLTFLFTGSYTIARVHV